MLLASRLACLRGDRLLFDDVNFALEPGAWVQVSGANGAGKTTLLRTVMGLCSPERGEVRWAGEPVGDRPEAFRRASIYLGHHAALKDDLTPLENLRVAGALDGSPVGEAEARSALERLGLRGRTGLPTRVLSAGQRRRALLARLLVRPAALWVLDEPFAALDTDAVDTVVEMLGTHLAGGGMALLTSHQPVALAGGGVLAL